jgi:hypothetical protein
MDSNQFSSAASTDTPNAGATKKPYEKPSFRFEKVFVTTALSCGKTSPVEQNCRGIGHMSAS